MRIVFFGFIIVLVVLSFGLAVRYNNDASYATEMLNGERYKRLTAEEELQKANRQIAALTADLKQAQDKLESTEFVLKNTKAINEDLKARLDKADQAKELLDKQIDELKQLHAPL